MLNCSFNTIAKFRLIKIYSKTEALSTYIKIKIKSVNHIMLVIKASTNFKLSYLLNKINLNLKLKNQFTDYEMLHYINVFCHLNVNRLTKY